MKDKKLKLNNSIKECLPVVSEYFIKFYGEEYREIIEKRFLNCTYIGFVFPEDMKRFLSELYQLKIREMYSDFFRDNDITYSDDNLYKYFGYSNGELRYPKNCKLSNLFEYIYNGLDDIYNRNNLINFLKDISGNKNLVFGSDDFNKLIEKIKLLKPGFDKLCLDFFEYKSNYKKYDRYVNICEDLEKSIREKYLLKYLKEVYEYLSENDRMVLDKVFNHELKLNIEDLECYQVLCGDVYSNVTLVDSFSSQCDEKINDPSTPKYILKSIYSDRVKYFKKKGIYLGRNYVNYENSLDCIKVLPDSDMVDWIIELRNNLSMQEREEYLTSTSLYKEYLEEINGLDLLDKNLNYKGFISGVNYVEPNLKKVNGKVFLHNILVINSKLFDDYYDNSFIHECSHLNEVKIVFQNEGYCIIRCGFETWLNVIDKSKYDSKKIEDFSDLDVDFSNFDEIINELIAQDITKMLHDDDIYLFDDKENSVIGKRTSYERFKLLVENFYVDFKEEIKHCRVMGDMDYLYNLVGRDNFLELNELINNFADYFDDKKYYEMFDDWNDWIDTVDTIYFDECLEKSRIILEKMKERASLCISDSNSIGM